MNHGFALSEFQGPTDKFAANLIFFFSLNLKLRGCSGIHIFSYRWNSPDFCLEYSRGSPLPHPCPSLSRASSFRARSTRRRESLEVFFPHSSGVNTHAREYTRPRVPASRAAAPPRTCAGPRPHSVRRGPSAALSEIPTAVFAIPSNFSVLSSFVFLSICSGLYQCRPLLISLGTIIYFSKLFPVSYKRSISDSSIAFVGQIGLSFSFETLHRSTCPPTLPRWLWRGSPVTEDPGLCVS